MWACQQLPGGAILSLKSLALNSVIIRDSAAIDGGGVAFDVQYPGQSLTIANSQFINNVAKPTVAGNCPDGNSGGALAAADRCNGARIPATMTIDGSVFSGNQVEPVGDVTGQADQVERSFWISPAPLSSRTRALWTIMPTLLRSARISATALGASAATQKA